MIFNHHEQKYMHELIKNFSASLSDTSIQNCNECTNLIHSVFCNMFTIRVFMFLCQ